MRREKPAPYETLIMTGAVALMLVLAMVLPQTAAAAGDDPYPSRTIRLIIPSAPGGSADVIGRLITTRLSELLGKQVILEYHSGAAGIIGTELVAKSKPDGYTLLFVQLANATSRSLYKLPYDLLKDFVAVAKIGNGPVVLTVHPSVPANSVKELIALAKKEPGKLICPAGGPGGHNHLASELFKMLAGIDYKIVQFKGGGPAMTDVMGGHSQLYIGTLAICLPPIQAGQLKVLGYGGPTRSRLLPNVPTISEAGVPGYQADNWWGIVAPAGTPKAVIDRLYKEVAVIMNSEETKKIFDGQGAVVDLMDSAEFGKFFEAEVAKWKKVIDAAHVTVE